LRAALEAKCKNEGLFFAALMVTDITALNSLLLVVGDSRFLEKIPFPKHARSGLYLCKGIMSRKKQLLPLLLEQLTEVLGRNY
jgi:inorganic pyrophosphatase/exopolyphosphatase